MAISYIVGIPRSGKSYLAVYKLWQKFIYKPKPRRFLKFLDKKDNDKKQYLHCFTNINQFDFSKSEKIHPLDFETLYQNLLFLYDKYKMGSDDDELIEYAKDFNLYKTFFVLDECHNFLTDREDKIITWWLTYHGHLYQDIYLITQNLDLVSKEYKKIAEFFYMAVEPSKRLNTKKFRYVQFSSYKMFQKDLIKGGGYNLPQLEEVFNLYKSGDKNLSKSIVQKYIKLSVFLIVFLLICGYFFLKQFDKSSPSAKPLVKDEVLNYDSGFIQKYKNTNDIHSFFYNIVCIGFFCKYKDFKFPSDVYSTYLNKNKDYQIQTYFYKSYQYIFLSFHEPNSFTRFLDKGALENASSKKDTSFSFPSM